MSKFILFYLSLIQIAYKYIRDIPNNYFNLNYKIFLAKIGKNFKGLRYLLSHFHS